MVLNNGNELCLIFCLNFIFFLFISSQVSKGARQVLKSINNLEDTSDKNKIELGWRLARFWILTRKVCTPISIY